MFKKHVLLLLKRLKGTYFEYSEMQHCYDQIVACICDERMLANFRDAHLQSLILHAYQNVPFYTERLKNIFKGDKLDFNKFNEVPLLTKDDIRKYWKDLISKDVGSRKWFYNSSGGSTGEPVKLIQDYLFNLWSMSSRRIYYENIIGIDELAVRKVILWGSERDIFRGTIGVKEKVMNWLTNTKLLNSFRMSEKDMERYVKIINSYKPDLIRAYAGSLYELCRFIERKKLPIHQPKVIVTSAEKLRREMRGKIESVFGTKVYDFYGSREVGGIAGECKAGLLHIFMFDNYVEVLDEHSSPVKEGEMGKVIVTNLHNYSMPLIRYIIGDTAVPGPRKCKCGCPLPTLREVSGRITDHFIKEDKTIIHGEYFTHLFYLKDWIKSFQIIQEDYKKIRIFAVLHGDINNAEKRDIENKIKFVMGDDCDIIWEFVDEIPVTSTGKHLYTKSLLYYG
jgi:phenylacetate-CoA ligase